MEMGEVEIVRSGERVGTLAYQSAILEGVLLTPAEERSPDQAREPEGVTVVATTMLMSDGARSRLRDAFGPSYLVLDVADAPPTADVVLTHPVSPQLLGSLRGMFPQARIIVTEIEDDELGVSAPGPVSRLLDAGASAYLPPRPLREVAANVHAYLTGSGAPQLTSGSPAVAALPSAGEETTPPG